VQIEERFAEKHRRQKTRFDFVAARTNCWSEENGRGHFAQNDNRQETRSKASGHPTEIVGMT
jgi:hypothetical protein